MQKRNAIAVAASVALVSLAGATTIGTSLADRGPGNDPAPAVSAATVPATTPAPPAVVPATPATDDRAASGDDPDSDDDRGRGRGDDDDDD
jgi:hypothetical protein